MGLEVVQQARVVGGTKTRNRIPTLSASETLARGGATSFGANVVTNGNIVETVGVSSGDLVEERGNVTERLASLGVDVVVQERDNSSEDRRGSRCSTNRLDGSVGKDENLRTESGDIRETSALSVVIAGRRKRNSRLEVVSDGSLLVSRGGGNEGETTTRSEVGLVEAHGLFGTSRSAAHARASRGWVGEVSLARSIRDLSGSDGGNVGGSTREDRVKVVLSTVVVSTAVGTRVTRGGEDGDTADTDLLEFDVDSLDVLGVVEAELLALSSTDTVLALGLFVPSVGDGVNEGDILATEHVGGETVQPDGIGFDPEPALSIGGNTEDVLDIEGGFDLRVGRLVGANDVVGGEGGDLHVELGGELGEIRGRIVLIFEFDDTSRGVSVYFSVSSSVHDLDGLGADGDGNIGVEVTLLLNGLEFADGELAESSNEVNVVGKVVRDGEVTKLTDDLLARFVLENLEGGGEEFGGSSNGSLGVDGISTVLEDFSATVYQPTHNFLGVVDGRSDQSSDFFNLHEVTIVGAVGVGHIPENLFEFLEVTLVKGYNERNFLGLFGIAQ